MGFLDDVGNWFGDLIGVNQSNQARSQREMAQQNEQIAGQTLQGISGKTATQFAQEAGKAGEAVGDKMGQEAARLGTQEAAQAARTAGLNKGQAALIGGQQAGKLFTQGQMQGQGLGMGAYGQGTQAQLGGALGASNLGQAQAGIGSGGNQAITNLMGGIGGMAGGIAASDKNLKENIKAAPDIREILKKIKPSSFNFKRDDKKQVGIMAQDIEKTPMKENVMDTPMGKMVDGAKQENSNLALIAQLHEKLDRIEKALSGGKKDA